MKNTIWMLLILAFIQSGYAQSVKKLTLEDIYKSSKFTTKKLDTPRWMPDGKSFIYIKKDSDQKNVYRYHVDSGKAELWIPGDSLIDPETGEVLSVKSYSISPSGKYIVFKADAKRVWRRFNDARFYLYSIAAKTLTTTYSGVEHIRHAKLSPDESKMGYVLDNNIYIKDMNSGTTLQVTKDGSENIINGQSDWVYEEEFRQSDGWRWSEDGNSIAFYRFDQKDVPRFSWTEFSGKYGAVKTIPYPKAGEPNSVIQIGVYNLNSQKTIWMDLGEEKDIYIPRIFPGKHKNTLFIWRMNRLQQKLEILQANTTTGSTKIIFTETDEAWLSLSTDIIWLDKKPAFIKTSETSGYQHIWFYDLDGRQKRQITKGKWEVSAVYGMGSDHRIYFQANRGKIEERHIFRINLDGTGLEQITKKVGTHAAKFNADKSFYIHTFSSVQTPNQIYLSDNNGKIKQTLVENSTDIYETYGFVHPEFLSFKTTDGVEIKAMMTKPRNFDSSKKYPVLIYGYSGPASQLVRNVWGRSGLWYTLLSQNDYIIFTIDQRGTGGRGKAFKNLAYGDIGKYMVKDHVEGVKYLQSLPYIDNNRIGIWGWSGGGYLTLMAMTKAADLFKAGIAVAPVSDYRLYDSIWTERYMGLPGKNSAGYDSSNALTYTDQYRGGLLIIHGSADDNVHMQNSMQFVEKLQESGKSFDMLIYPGKNHSMLGKGSVYYHLYSKMTNFIFDNL